MENAPNAIPGFLQESAEVDEKEGDALRSGVAKCAESWARERSDLGLRRGGRRVGGEKSSRAGKGRVGSTCAPKDRPRPNMLNWMHKSCRMLPRPYIIVLTIWNWLWKTGLAEHAAPLPEEGERFAKSVGLAALKDGLYL